jgi:hypothetical protein
MSKTSLNLSRRALVTAAAVAVPAIALSVAALNPSLASAGVASTRTIDARLLALGEQLKPLFVEWMKLWSKRTRLYDRVFAELGELPAGGDDETIRRYKEKFKAVSKRVGYWQVAMQSNRLQGKIWKLAREILAIPATTRGGLLVRAVAALSLDETFELRDRFSANESQTALWEIAYVTGFAVPGWVSRSAKRRSQRAIAEVPVMT